MRGVFLYGPVMKQMEKDNGKGYIARTLVMLHKKTVVFREKDGSILFCLRPELAAELFI